MMFKCCQKNKRMHSVAHSYMKAPFLLWVFVFLSCFCAAFASAEVYTHGYGSNPKLSLCKEFKAYLERHHDKPLYCDLIPDSAFKDFRLPKWQPAPEGLPLRIEIQSRTVQSPTARSKKPFDVDDYIAIVNEAKAYVNEGAKHRVTVVDINHDGEPERIWMRQNPKRCLEKNHGYHFVKIYGEHHNIDSSFISERGKYLGARGDVFFYKGRIYLARGSYSSFNIVEPSRFKSDRKLFIPYDPVCVIDRKVFER